MSDKAQQSILEAAGRNAATANQLAQQIVVAYAGSGNAHAPSIPWLYQALVELFTTGKNPE